MNRRMDLQFHTRCITAIINFSIFARLFRSGLPLLSQKKIGLKLRWCIALGLLICGSKAAMANTNDPWSDQFYNNGLSGSVNAMVTAADGSIYVGGVFGSAGRAASSGVAKWNEATESWESLGGGVGWQVYALASAPDGTLYAGGGQRSGSFSGVGLVWQWNTSTENWDEIGNSANGLIGTIEALAVGSDGTVYAGGTSGSGYSAGYVSQFNPSSSDWEQLGSNLVRRVTALAMAMDGTLHAGAGATLGGSPRGVVAKWDGVAWTDLGIATNYDVKTLAFDLDDTLYAGGTTGGGGIRRPFISRLGPSLDGDLDGDTEGDFNGDDAIASGWEQIDVSLMDIGSNGVYSLKFSNSGILHAGDARGVSKWSDVDGSWERMGSELNSVVNDITFGPTGTLYAGGGFTRSIDGMSFNRAAKFNASSGSWEPLGTDGNGLNGGVYSMVAGPDDLVYVGGRFSLAGGSGVFRTTLAKWNGLSWQELTGVDQDIDAIAVGQDGSVYLGDRFGVTVWDPVSNQLTPLAGLSGQVNALIVHPDGSLYAGGEFVSGIRRWNGSTWESVGNDLDNDVFALAIGPDQKVYAGGRFEQRVAEWDGVSWTGFGDGPSMVVYAIAVDGDGAVYVGGESFLDAAVAKWDGDAWDVIGEDLDNTINRRVLAIALGPDAEIYAAGWPTDSGNLALWNGSTWNTLGSGVKGTITALAVVPDRTLYAAGFFSIAGGKVSNSIAAWDIPVNAPPIANAGVDQTGIEAESAIGAVFTLDGSLSSDAETEADQLNYSWMVPSGILSGITVDVELPLGTTTVGLEVNDGTDSDTDTVDITVVDTTAPDLVVPPDIDTTTEMDSIALNLGTPTVSDLVSAEDDIEISNDAPEQFAADQTTTVTWTATDQAGNSTDATQIVTVTKSDTGKQDTDGDGVADTADVCPLTMVPEVSVPSNGNLSNYRYALTDPSAVTDSGAVRFVTNPVRDYTTLDTAGCSCEQILLLTGSTKMTDYKSGCRRSVLDDFIEDLANGTYSVPEDQETEADTDMDGVVDSEDVFPNDPTESADFDADGIGDNADTDDDNDGVQDDNDAFPRNPNETSDFDGDLIGNNADTDDDNDGQSDAHEIACASNPLDASDTAPDSNGNGIPDCVDEGGAGGVDTDADGVLDSLDICPATVVPEQTVPELGSLANHRYALTDVTSVDESGAIVFISTPANFIYSTADTSGCSCEQILGLTGNTRATERKRGCARSTLDNFIDDVQAGVY